MYLTRTRADAARYAAIARSFPKPASRVYPQTTVRVREVSEEEQEAHEPKEPGDFREVLRAVEVNEGFTFVMEDDAMETY